MNRRFALVRVWNQTRPADNRSAARHEHGFTMLELLVALAIAATMLVLLLQMVRTRIQTVNDARAYYTAMSLARSHLAMLGRNVEDVEPDTHGRDGPFDWRIRVTPEMSVNQPTNIVDWFRHKDEARPRLYAVSITVSWRANERHRELHVDTRRLGFVPPPPPELP